MKSAQEIEESLPHFSGSEEWHQYGGILLTDGVKWLCEAAECFWLAGIVDSLRCVPAARNEDFLTIKLVVRNERANFIATDGGKDGNKEKTVYRQFIEYTDFPCREVTLYFTNKVLMLTSEY